MWFMFRLGQLVRDKLAGSTDRADRPVLDLTWDYPVIDEHGEPNAEAILAEINGWDADGQPLSSYEQLRDDGSTVCGCWIYCGVYAEGINQAARRKPWTEQDQSSREWGWAWPANRRELYNRASADPHGAPWSERKKLIWWDTEQQKWVGNDVPDFPPTKSPDYRPRPGRDRAGRDRGQRTVHHAGRRTRLAVRACRAGRRPTVRQQFTHSGNLLHPSGTQPGAEVFPFVLTTYRLTEHFTAGGMTRWQPYLAELQPALFGEVSPQLADERGLTHNGWATLVSARGAIEARVAVTTRMRPLQIQGRTIHQIGMPYHWGPNGLTTGDAVNELSAIALDPNVHIQEVKALTVDIQAGRRPSGPKLPIFLADYRARAGITEHTGTEV